MESRNYLRISLLPVATYHRLSNATHEPPIGQIPAILSVDAGQPAGSAGRRLLVVDDNVDLALTTAMLLRTKQYETHARFSGADALADVEQLQPDVILLDLGMPDMDGFETAARLRALPWGQHGVIVALTGYGQPEDRQQTRDAGFDGHLVKPFNMSGLIALLTQLLGSRE